MSLTRKFFDNPPSFDDFNKIREEFVALLDGLKAKIALAEVFSVSLLKERITSLRLLQELGCKISSLNHTPECLQLGIERANGFMSIIKEAYKSVDITFLPDFSVHSFPKNIEKDPKKTHLSKAIAISTTFGITITRSPTPNMTESGLELPTLSSRMTSDRTLFMLLGPLGWNILGVARMFVRSYSLKRRETENGKLGELKDGLSKLENTVEKVNQMIDDISQLKDKTNFYNHQLRLLVDKIDSVGVEDFEDEKFPKEELFESVEFSKFIGKLSQQIIKIPFYDYM